MSKDKTVGDVLCEQVVHRQGAGMAFARGHKCGRKAIVIYDGKNYCKIHNPVFVKEKRDAMEKLWDEASERRRKEDERRELEQQYCKNLTNDQLKTSLGLPMGEGKGGVDE